MSSAEVDFYIEAVELEAGENSKENCSHCKQFSKEFFQRTSRLGCHAWLLGNGAEKCCMWAVAEYKGPEMGSTKLLGLLKGNMSRMAYSSFVFV